MRLRLLSPPSASFPECKICLFVNSLAFLFSLNSEKSLYILSFSLREYQNSTNWFWCLCTTWSIVCIWTLVTRKLIVKGNSEKYDSVQVKNLFLYILYEKLLLLSSSFWFWCILWQKTNSYKSPSLDLALKKSHRIHSISCVCES